MGCQQSKATRTTSTKPAPAPQPQPQPVALPIRVVVACEAPTVQIAPIKQIAPIIQQQLREVSPEVCEQPPREPSVAPTTQSRDTSASSLEGVEPTIFQICAATSAHKMYRRWTRKNRMIAARFTAEEATAAHVSMAFDYVIARSSMEAIEPVPPMPLVEEFMDAPDASAPRMDESPLRMADQEEAIDVEPQSLYNSPFAASPLRTQSINQRAASEANQTASPFGIRSINMVASSPLKSSLAASPVKQQSVAGSPQRMKSDVIAVEDASVVMNDENAVPLPLCTPVKSVAFTEEKPTCGSVSVSAKKKSRKGANNSSRTKEPVGSRWDRGTRANMQPQMYMEMAAAFQRLLTDKNSLATALDSR